MLPTDAPTPLNSNNAFKRPVSFLSSLQCLLALLGEIGLAAVADSVFEKNGFPFLAGAFTLSGFDSLSFLKLLLDVSGLGVLFVHDGRRDTAPER